MTDIAPDVTDSATTAAAESVDSDPSISEPALSPRQQAERTIEERLNEAESTTTDPEGLKQIKELRSEVRGLRERAKAADEFADLDEGHRADLGKIAAMLRSGNTAELAAVLRTTADQLDPGEEVEKPAEEKPAESDDERIARLIEERIAAKEAEREQRSTQERLVAEVNETLKGFGIDDPESVEGRLVRQLAQNVISDGQAAGTSVSLKDALSKAHKAYEDMLTERAKKYAADKGGKGGLVGGREIPKPADTSHLSARKRAEMLFDDMNSQAS